MSRMVGRSRQVESHTTGIKLSEGIIMVAILLVALGGIRAYWLYRQSPGYIIKEFVGAVKAGSVERQYALISEVDKQQYFQDESAYKKFDKTKNLLHGYAERILDVTVAPVDVKPDTTDTNVQTTIKVRSLTKNITDVAETKDYIDTFHMHKDADGKWRVVLSKSGKNGQLNLYQATPNPPGDSF